MELLPFFDPVKEGWLWKQGGRYKSWKWRWFILSDNCLYYFEHRTDKVPRGIIPLQNVQVREATDRLKPYCLELYTSDTGFVKACKTNRLGEVVKGKHLVYRMSAFTTKERDEWINCVRSQRKMELFPFFDPVKEGYLWKQGGRYKSWKWRWFILSDNCLYYFEHRTDKVPRGIIPLQNVQVREATDRLKPYCLELYTSGTGFVKACKTNRLGEVVKGKHKVYRMSAFSTKERDEWINCVGKKIMNHCFRSSFQ